ncbi:serine/threonine-protein phosphatase, partial [Actinomadura latina]|nr:serine/threonine-protein phosphatase [Actinomadura latina]
PPVAVDERPPPPAPAPMADPMGGPPAPMRQAPPRRGGARRWTWLVVVAGVVVVGVVAGGFVLLQNVRNGYYIGAENGNAVLFRGTPQKVPGLDLSRKADATGLQPIKVADLPQDLQQQVKDTYTVDGPGAWNMLVDRVCRYSLVDESGKVGVVRGRNQQNCQETKLQASDIQLAQLPTSDATKVRKGEFVFIGRDAATAELNQLKTRRDKCKSNDPGIPDCPSNGGSS